MSTDLANHNRSFAYDSAVTVGAAVKGRSSSGSIARELHSTGVYLLAMDGVEGALWCESEHNIADSSSRQEPLPVPAPRRPWVHQFLQGDTAAFVARREGRIGRVGSSSEFPAPTSSRVPGGHGRDEQKDFVSRFCPREARARC